MVVKMKNENTLDEKVQAVFEGWINSQNRLARMIHNFETDGNDGIHIPGHEYEVGEDGIVRCKTNPKYEVPIGKHIQKESNFRVRGRLKLHGDIREDFDELFLSYKIYDPFEHGYVPHLSLLELRGGNTVWHIWESYSEHNGYSSLRDKEIPGDLKNVLDTVYKAGKAPKEVLEEIRAHIIALAEVLDYVNDHHHRTLPEKRFHYITERFRRSNQNGG